MLVLFVRDGGKVSNICDWLQMSPKPTVIAVRKPRPRNVSVTHAIKNQHWNALTKALET